MLPADGNNVFREQGRGFPLPGGRRSPIRSGMTGGQDRINRLFCIFVRLFCVSHYVPTQQAGYHPGEPHDRERGGGGQGDRAYARRAGGFRGFRRAGRRGERAAGPQEKGLARGHDHQAGEALRAASGAVLRAFCRVRRMPLAAAPLRDPAGREAAAGL